MRGALLALVLALVGTGAAGCKDLRYYDVDVTFDTATFGSSGEVSTIQTCHVFVTGAENADFYIRNAGECLGNTTGSHLGTFEYSSLAEEGNLTFTMKVYNGLVEDTPCLFGEGSVTVPVTPTTTSKSTMLVKNNGTTGCRQ